MAFRIFDPDSPVQALLATSVFQPASAALPASLTIAGFSVKQSDVTLGRIALKCVLYDASQTRVLAESGYFIYALPQSVSGIPTILSGGVVDAARGSATVSRGSLASIYGSSLAAFVTKNDYVPVTTNLGGVQVSVGGQFAPIIYTSPTLINFQVPFETPVSSAVPITVTRAGLTSTPVNVAVADYAPQVFVYGAALNPIVVHLDGKLVTGANPAKAGEPIVVFGTGIGKVSHTPGTGRPAEEFPFESIASDAVTATLGGMNATVSYCGLTAGFIGLVQFNITIPNSLPSRPTAPLVIRVGGASSLPVEIAVQ